MTKPDDVRLPPHAPLCANLLCGGECVKEMMGRIERGASARTSNGNAYRKLMG
jgi:hypothetical protein